jgi:hypothetical protein
VIARLVGAGHWREGDPAVLVIFDGGDDVARLAFLLAGLPVEVLGRLRSDRVMQLPAPPRRPGTTGRPSKHGGELALSDPATWPAPHVTTSTLTSRCVRRGFRNIPANLPCPAGAPKPGKPSPGRPPGLRNRRPAPRYDVGKTTKRERTFKARRNRAR